MNSASRVSVRLIISYILDWIFIVAIAAVGAAFSTITPNKRPFDLANHDLAFPFVEKEKISTAVLVVVSLIIPAGIIFIIALFIGLGSSAEKPSRTSLLRRKLWELNAGWMGLALSLAIAFLITNGTKNLAGKPRPDLLARCDPNIENLLNSTVGGIGGQVDEGVNLVSWTICRNPGETLDEGFRSFPSGHSSFSFAGLTYLALFLAAKLAITIPFLSYSSPNSSLLARNQAAAPPTYLLIFPLIPICAAIYISSTRYSDFYHHGFDIIAGAALGIVSGWFGFRWYHLPINRGAGWAWAPRSPERAFGRGIGAATYASEGIQGREDLETGAISGRGTGGIGRAEQPASSQGQGMELDDLGSVGEYVGSDSSRRPLR